MLLTGQQGYTSLKTSCSNPRKFSLGNMAETRATPNEG